MDPITHSLTGALLARSSRIDSDWPAEQKRFWFWVLFIAAEFPDADVLLLPFHIADHLMFYHRSFTHSIFGAVLQALALAYLIRFEIKTAFWKIFSVTSLAFLAHVMEDLMTSYGTPIFAPFSWKTYSLDWVSNLTLIPLIIFAAALLTAKLKPRRKFQAVYSGWLSFILFLAISAGFHLRALHIVGENGIAAMPYPINPFVWYGIETLDRRQTYQTYAVAVVSGRKKLLGHYSTLEKYADDPRLKNIVKLPEFKRYKTFNRWPVCRITKEGAESSVNLGNLLFRWHGQGALGHSMLVRVSRNGKILSVKKSVFESDPLE